MFLYNHRSVIKISQFNTDTELISIPYFMNRPHNFIAVPPGPGPGSPGTHVAFRVMSVLESGPALHCLSSPSRVRVQAAYLGERPSLWVCLGFLMVASTFAFGAQSQECCVLAFCADCPLCSLHCVEGLA